MSLDITALESWLWEAACIIRGPVDAPKFKDYILPLIFLKRLSDVFEDEIKRLEQDFGSHQKALKLADADHKLVRFFVPDHARWANVAKQTKGVGEYLTDAVRAVAKVNPRLQGVIDVTDYNATQAGQRILDDDRLRALVQRLSIHRLGLDDVEPDLFGDAYEYLLRKFAEGQGSSAGEFYTPGEVAILMAHVLDPEPGQTVYDSNCGSAGLLIKSHLRLVQKFGVKKNGHVRLPERVAPLRLFGQEINPATFAMARMNAFIHDMEAEIALGDTMTSPKFTNPDGSLRRFDLCAANPMWNQDNIPSAAFENDTLSRFCYGLPPIRNADWGWVQHLLSSLAQGGRLAVVLDTGALTRGSGTSRNDREHAIRKAIVRDDLVEAVFLLPENLFYNTPNAGIILVLNRKKRHPGETLMVDLSFQFQSERPKNILKADGVEAAAACYSAWHSRSGLASVVKMSDIADEDFNLLPTRYVVQPVTGNWAGENDRRVSLHLSVLKRAMLFAALSHCEDSRGDSRGMRANLVRRHLGQLLSPSELRLRDLEEPERLQVGVLSLTKESGLIVQDQRFSRSIAIADLSAYKVVKRGWVVYNPMVIWEGAIHALHDYDVGVVSPAYQVWIPQGTDYRFLDYILKTPKLLAEYRRLASGGVNRRRIVSPHDFKAIEVLVPDSVALAKLMQDLDQAVERVAHEVERGIELASHEIA